ncbi:MAG: NADPH:quinone reductase [Ramlibacter sp.]
MQAAFYTRQGPAAEVLSVGEQPTPQPGPGEVRVRIRASGANPSDWKTRKGGGGRKLIAPLVIPHSDGAGDIDAVGAGVPAGRIGERVWIWNGQWKRPFGTAAEFIALPAQQAVTLPASVSYDEGACLGIPGFTAWQAVRIAALQTGDTVLVQGGAGSVGHYAIQLAKLRGATVLATVSCPAKAAHARAAGADHAIDYRREDVGARVAELTGGRGVDCVIEMDLTANAAQYPKLLRPDGRVVVYGLSGVEATLPTLWLMQNSITLEFFLVYEIAQADREAGIRELTDLLAAGKLRHTIALRLPLAEIARAHDLIEGGTLMGNVVLAP